MWTFTSTPGLTTQLHVTKLNCETLIYGAACLISRIMVHDYSRQGGATSRSRTQRCSKHHERRGVANEPICSEALHTICTRVGAKPTPLTCRSDQHIAARCHGEHMRTRVRTTIGTRWLTRRSIPPVRSTCRLSLLRAGAEEDEEVAGGEDALQAPSEEVEACIQRATS